MNNIWDKKKLPGGNTCIIRPCLVCGKEFTKLTANSKYCDNCLADKRKM